MNTCQHCGRTVGGGSALVRHERSCTNNPVAYAATVAIMADIAQPDMAVRSHVYARRKSSAPDAISDRTLVIRYGSWPAACAAFGFGAPCSDLNAPLTEWERHACARRGRLEFAG